MKRSKVWALRCGHMFDGKCIDSIMKPAQTVEAPDEPAPAVPDLKGKGKAKDTDGASVANPDDTLDVLVSSKSRGKRKASELDADEDASSAVANADISTAAHSIMPGTFEPIGIRARLRPRNGRSGQVPGANTEAAMSPQEESSPSPCARYLAAQASTIKRSVHISKSREAISKGQGERQGKSNGGCSCH